MSNSTDSDDINLKNLKKSNSWELTYIHINDNWSLTSLNDWCNGDGSWSNPYVIENVTIDASSSPTGNGIFIENSKNVYFVIRNVTIFNAGIDHEDAAIKLRNTNNGNLFKNNCSYNGGNGIWLFNSCNNNTISENTVNNNTYDGIYLSSSQSNTISKNIVNNNTSDGIFLSSSYNNIVSGNTANNNSMCGININFSNNNTFSQNTANNNKYGIDIYWSEYNTVSENTVYENFYEGIELWAYCDYTTVTGNIANKNRRGIWIYTNNSFIIGNDLNNNTECGIIVTSSNNNVIFGNSVNNNSDCGISIQLSSDNTISNNTVNNNQVGICLSTDNKNNNISENNVNNNTECGIKLLYDSSSNIVSENNATNNIKSGIYISSGNNNTISGNIVNNNTENGIYLSSSDNNTISGNIVNNNTENGIYLSSSSNNTIVGNLIKSNLINGIQIDDISSQNNLIYHNALKENNKWHASDTGINNHWNNSIVGNYWDNHTSPDDNTDNIVDTEYISINGTAGSIDYFPLVESPVYEGEIINIDDSGPGLNNWSQIAKLKAWVSGSGTYFDPYIIDGLEIDGGGSEACITIQNSNVYFTIKNCKVHNAGSFFLYAGICLYGTGNGSLINNDFLNNRFGISLFYGYNIILLGNTFINNTFYAVYMEDSSDNNLSGNFFIKNNYGIFLSSSSNNKFLENTAINNYAGILLGMNCYNNNISGNTAFNNTAGIALSNGNVDNIISNNTTNNNGIGISLGNNCNNNQISGNNANNNTNYGIYLEFSSNNTISNNNVSSNKDSGLFLTNNCKKNNISENVSNNNTNHGIYLGDNCDDNTLSGNSISSNNLYGIYISTSDCQDNLFYNNTLDNDINAIDNGNNDWNNSIIGNSWSDYSGSDLNDDGIGDTPYSKNGVIDYLPIYSDGDDTKPVITINSPEDYEKFATTPPSINVSITDPNLEHTWFTLQNSAVTSDKFDWNGNIMQEQWNLFGNGLIIITFYANDTAGHIQTQVLRVIKRVGIWLLPPFIIDDLGTGTYNWTEAFNLGLCTGSGTSADPYVIENIIIDGHNSSSGLEISNTSSYFVIRDCIFYSSGSSENMAGLKLKLANNGRLFSNNCSQNFGSGIFLDSCENITISHSTVNNNSYNGILLSNCKNISIKYNDETINHNKRYGIHLRLSDYNKISNNTINFNSEFGIYLENSSYNNVTYNDLRDNHKGAIKQEGKSIGNIISDNNLSIGGGTQVPIEIIIIIIISIIAVLSVTGVLVWKKKLFVPKTEQEEKLVFKFGENEVKNLKNLKKSLKLIEDLIKESKFDKSIKALIAIQKAAQVYNLSKIVNIIEEKIILYRKSEAETISKIKQTILALGGEYTLLQLTDISERTGIQNEELIETVIEDMINKKEIYGDYFSSSKSLKLKRVTPIPEKEKIAKYNIFLSYATIDSDYFQIPKVFSRLELYPEIGEVLFWKADSKQNIVEYMEEALKKTNTFILFCSKNSMKSEAVKGEWQSAYQMVKKGLMKIIPIYEDDDDIPRLLWHMLNVKFTKDDFEGFVLKLYEEILR